MPQTYLLPCPGCERKLPIEPTQAGAPLVCECGKKFTAPAFREIRQLEAAPQVENKPAAAKWSRMQGMMFSLGILAFLVALGLGYYPVVWRSQISLEPPPPADMTAMNAMVDSWPPAETLEAWEELLIAGINRSGPPPHVAMRPVATQLNVMIGIAAAVALAGLGSAIAAFFVGKEK